MIIKCKMCGGDMVVSPDQKTGTCEYCGSTMTLPKVDDDQRAAAFNRGNHFRRIGEFDKAMSVYEGIIREDENDAEAHWCCALCRFGIEYVKDPASGEYLPTCHRASFDSFLEDVDYKAALEHADVVARAQYQKDAEKIAQVQRGILSISQKEQPFDVFICYKESDENGNRTVDSTLAQDIYYQLTEQGRRVFFARITLEDKAGQEYEPYIFAALHSAKVMVVVGTKPEYLNAVWVKNEWSRYLALMKHDRKRLLIPCYRNMDPYDLPEQLSVLQSYDMSKIGFIQDLIRGIAKVLDADKKPERIEEKETVIIQGEGGANLTALLKRGQQALEDEDWEKADEFFDQALNIDAESGEAFFGKAMAGMQARNRKAFIDSCSADHDIKPEYLELPKPKAERSAVDDVVDKLLPPIQLGDVLEACPRDTQRIGCAETKYAVPGYLTKDEIRTDFDEREMRRYVSAASIRRVYKEDWEERLKVKNKNLVRAKQYARGAFAEELSGIYGEIESILARRLGEAEERDKAVAAKKKADYEHFLELAEKMVAEKNELAVARRDADYQNAQTAEEHATTQTAFLEAAKQYEKVRYYKDALERAEACRKKAAEVAAEAERLRKEKEARKVRTRQQFIKKAVVVAVSIAVITVIAITVNDKVLQPFLKYKRAENLMTAGEYEAAADAFTVMGDYLDAPDKRLEALYAEAESLLTAGKSDAAIKAFEALGNYADASEKVLEIKYKAAESLLEVGDYEAAAKAFAALGDYSDASDKSLEAGYAEAENLLKAGNYEAAAKAFAALGDYSDASDKSLEAGYAEAENLLKAGNYEAAAKAFAALGDYSDASDKSLEAGYAEAENLLKAGNYEAAAEAFAMLGDYSDSSERSLEVYYEGGTKYLQEKKYRTAINFFEKIEGYRDADQLLDEAYEYFTIGNEVIFGSYEQDGNIGNGAEDIKWLVLDKEGDKVLLLSKYGLDAKPYNESRTNITWKQSTIRNWLNGEFVNTAFSSDEQTAILQTEVDNSQAEGDSEYGINSENNTKDQVFLLSYKEAFEDYFTSDEARICMPTTYAVQQGADKSKAGACRWWLRSPGDIRSRAAVVLHDGSHLGFNVNLTSYCVRPALWIDLKSDIF